MAATAGAIVAQTLQRFGRIDVLVNNDGAPPLGEIESFDDVAWSRAVEQNLMTWCACRAARCRRWGRIVNITALSALQPILGQRGHLGRRDRLCRPYCRSAPGGHHGQHAEDAPAASIHGAARHGVRLGQAGRRRRRADGADAAPDSGGPGRPARRYRRPRRLSLLAVGRLSHGRGSSRRRWPPRFSPYPTRPTSSPGISRALDFEQQLADYPPPPTYFEAAARSCRATARCRRSAFSPPSSAWLEIPFFQRHWGERGLEPDDIRDIDDLTNPGLRRQRHPQEHRAQSAVRRLHEHRRPTASACRWCCISGGTAACRAPCSPRAWGRETMAILGAPSLAMQGVAGRHGAGHAIARPRQRRHGAARGDVALQRRGAGIDGVSLRRRGANRDRQGIRCCSAFRQSALVCRDELGIGVEVARHPPDRHPPRRREPRAARGALGRESVRHVRHPRERHARRRVHAPDRDARDGRRLPARSPSETGVPVPDGEKVPSTSPRSTAGAPQIRFNVNDISAWHTGTCPCGNTMRRIQRIFGRNDNMVKLRGVGHPFRKRWAPPSSRTGAPMANTSASSTASAKPAPTRWTSGSR